MKKMSIHERAARKLKFGQYVRVVRRAKDGKDGWRNSWISKMDKYIGRVYKIDDINEVTGVRLRTEDGHVFYFPAHVLKIEKSTQWAPIVFDLSGNYNLMVHKTGHITVGCQTIKPAMTRKIIKAFEAVMRAKKRKS